MHQDRLDKFSILSIRHDPLDQFCPMRHGVLNEFLMTDEIDASTKHHPTACHHDLPSSTTGTQLQFSCGATVVPPRYLVCASLGFSSPDIFGKTRIFPERTWCCTHKSPTAKCRTFPNSSRWTIPIAAVASDSIATWPHKQKSFKIDCGPMPSVAALNTAANSDPPLLKGTTPIVLDHALTNWPLHSATPPTVDFLVEWLPAKFVSNTSILLSNWVPWISAGHSRVFDCTPCNSREGFEVLCRW